MWIVFVLLRVGSLSILVPCDWKCGFLSQSRIFYSICFIFFGYRKRVSRSHSSRSPPPKSWKFRLLRVLRLCKSEVNAVAPYPLAIKTLCSPVWQTLQLLSSCKPIPQNQWAPFRLVHPKVEEACQRRSRKRVCRSWKLGPDPANNPMWKWMI